MLSHSLLPGLYVLKEDLHLATPPPHPSDTPVPNPNPLATTPQPPSAGTKLSLLSLDVRPLPPAFLRAISSGSVHQQSIQEHPDEGKSSTTEARTSTSDGGGGTGSRGVASSELPVWTSNAPAFGEGNVLLAPQVTKDANKRRKPKNKLDKSNSSFISRVILHENLNKRLQDRTVPPVYAFANINRSFQWLDLASPTKVRGGCRRIESGAGLTPSPGRLSDEDFIHKGALPLPRRKRSDPKLFSH